MGFTGCLALPCNRKCCSLSSYLSQKVAQTRPFHQLRSATAGLICTRGAYTIIHETNICHHD